MLAHLRKNSADVQMNIGGVQHLEAVVYGFITVVKIVVFNLKSLFKV